MRVSYADLDIRDTAGAHRLMQRIARAAASVCGGGPDSRLYDDKLRFDRCRADAYGRAMMQIDAATGSAAAASQPTGIVVAAR
jgi:UrcA family protein